MATSMFNEPNLTLDNYWRSIILCGLNSACFKFALAKSLLDLSESKSDLITLEQLADPFSKHICEHLVHSGKQGTSRSSKFLDSCRQFNAGELGHQDLLDTTRSLGFVNVIDAFHIVSGDEIPNRFFLDERTGNRKGIRLTDSLYELATNIQFENLHLETEARWRLVETAWELNLPKHSLYATVEFDPTNEGLFASTRDLRRKSITGCRDALNGYQKGECFYCRRAMVIEGARQDRAEVDHFLPHALKEKCQTFGPEIDSIWNLVLACNRCNAGEGGKSAKIPSISLLERLHARNNDLIESYHPLRETLMQQTGMTERKRRGFLNEVYDRAKRILIHTWDPKDG